MSLSSVRLIADLESRFLFVDSPVEDWIREQKILLQDNSCKIGQPVDHIFDYPDLMSLLKPELLLEFHETSILSGANIIRTNTASANSLVMDDRYFSKEVRKRINTEAVEIAFDAIQNCKSRGVEFPLYLAGVIGPTNVMASSTYTEDHGSSPLLQVDNEFSVDSAYAEQLECFVNSKVDFIFLDGLYDLNHLKILKNLLSSFHSVIPLLATAVVVPTLGALHSGESIEDFGYLANSLDILAIGLSRSYSLNESVSWGQRLSKIFHGPLISSLDFSAYYPNSIFPISILEDELLVDSTRILASDGRASILGGNWPSMPKHTKTIVESLANMRPQRVE